MGRFLLCLLAVLPLLAADSAGEIAALRQQLAAQQKQLDELRQRLDHLSAASASGGAGVPPAAGLRPGAAPAPAPESSPLSLHIGAADFTPGGFMDFTSIFRSTNVGSGIGTAFSGIPFNNTLAGKESESRFSAQNSRVSLKITAHPGRSSVTGYLETDLLGALPANAHVSSNSDSMRLRLYWLDWQRGHWEVLAGQSWSMLTPGRTGISPVPSDLFYTQNMDTNYQVGLTWTRAPQFRVVYHAGNGFHAGFAMENPQQYASNATLPAFAQTQLDNGTLTGVPNLHPDLQAKLAYDGKSFHVEAAGVLRGFRILRANLSPSTIQGGAGSLNGNVTLVKNLRLFLTTYYGSGGGRYLFGLGPDLIVRPNGDLSPIHSGGGIAGFEYQANARALLYAYYGTTYFGRNSSLGPDGKYVGYGFPGSTSNRSIQEYTLGYTHTFWKNPNYGAIQLVNQYSYLTRAPWAGPQTAHTHMLYNNLRYVLP
jgi:hypothetical protein